MSIAEKHRGAEVLGADIGLGRQQGLLQGEAYHILVTLLQEQNQSSIEELGLPTQHVDDIARFSKAGCKDMQKVSEILGMYWPLLLWHKHKWSGLVGHIIKH